MSKTYNYEWDLTADLCKYLDVQLCYPLLEFVDERKIFENCDLGETKLALLEKTKMADFAIDVWKKHHPDAADRVPERLLRSRERVVEELVELRQCSEAIVKLLSQDELVTRLRKNKDFHIEYLKENYGVGADDLAALHRFAKFQFDCGQYDDACRSLQHFRALSSDAEANASALWGKLACEILLQRWDAAMDSVNRLKDTIESKSFHSSPLKQLEQRSWLLHWALFVFFNHRNGREALLDLFFNNDKYLNALQTRAPHLLRYLTAAVITSGRRRSLLAELVKVLEEEGYTYRDPLTEFVVCLYVNFDFDSAQLKLNECDQVLCNDFFLVSSREEFMENARLVVFENYCSIHQRIDIAMLAAKLEMSESDAELWIVNLIRRAHLNAKIDAANGHVLLANQAPNVYEKVIAATSDLGFRTHVLARNIAKRKK